MTRLSAEEARLVQNPLRFSLTHDQRIMAVTALGKGEAPQSVASRLGVDQSQLRDLAVFERWPWPQIRAEA